MSQLSVHGRCLSPFSALVLCGLLVAALTSPALGGHGGGSAGGTVHSPAMGPNPVNSGSPGGLATGSGYGYGYGYGFGGTYFGGFAAGYPVYASGDPSGFLMNGDAFLFGAAPMTGPADAWTAPVSLPPTRAERAEMRRQVRLLRQQINAQARQALRGR
jgi:hypothetical protein